MAWQVHLHHVDQQVHWGAVAKLLLNGKIARKLASLVCSCCRRHILSHMRMIFKELARGQQWDSSSLLTQPDQFKLDCMLDST